MTKITWQDILNVLTLKSSDTGILKKINDVSDIIEKFRLCYDANKVYLEEWLAEHTAMEGKCASKCIELRLAGNNVYKRGKDLEALTTYNSSVAAAPHNTNLLALALANRSAVLGRLQFYEEGIKDIDLALQHGDSEIPRTKLLIRKALFLHKLKLFKDSLHVIKSLFPDEEQICQQKNLELKNAYFDSQKEIKNSTVMKSSEPDQCKPLPKGGQNERFPSASANVILKQTKEKGRHVITTEDFEMSDVIFVEKPFALVVLPDQYQHHCHHCCKEIIAYIPCQECTKAFFCSEVCRKESWTKYHQWECRGLEICHSIGIAHLGLRVALLADSSAKYQQVFDLTTHIEDMKEEDVFQYSLTALLLTLYLEQYTSFFKCNPALSIEEMGSRILHHIAQLICNGHAITKIDSNLSEKGCLKTVSEAQVRIATAIYPSASMMNHSCDPNISNNFINEWLVVRASKHIKAGEEVFNCYGPQYKTMSREERQKVLQSQYFFTCDCRWCSKSCESELQQFSALLCSQCAGPVMQGRAECAHCHRTQPLIELVNMSLMAQQVFHQGQKLLKEGKAANALSCLQESVSLSSKCLYKHNSDLRTYKDSLARVYAELGMYEKSVALIEECIITIDKQFGCNSVEISRELLKLFDLLSLDLTRLTKSGLQDSDEYRNKLSKMKKTLKQTKKIIETNMDATYLNKIPELVAALNSVDLS